MLPQKRSSISKDHHILTIPSSSFYHRFDREIGLGVPDQAGRARILEVMTRKMRLQGDFDYQAIAKKTSGYVGADLASLTKEAAVLAINRIFKLVETTKEKAQPEAEV